VVFSRPNFDLNIHVSFFISLDRKPRYFESDFLIQGQIICVVLIVKSNSSGVLERVLYDVNLLSI
jgi:hypothetical protein